MINRHVFIGGRCTVCGIRFHYSSDEEGECVDREELITYTTGGDPEQAEGFLLTHFFWIDGRCTYCELTESFVKEAKQVCENRVENISDL